MSWTLLNIWMHICHLICLNRMDRELSINLACETIMQLSYLYVDIFIFKLNRSLIMNYDFVPIRTKNFFPSLSFFQEFGVYSMNDFLLCLNQIVKVEFIAIICLENVFVPINNNVNICCCRGFSDGFFVCVRHPSLWVSLVCFVWLLIDSKLLSFANGNANDGFANTFTIIASSFCMASSP